MKKTLLILSIIAVILIAYDFKSEIINAKKISATENKNLAGKEKKAESTVEKIDPISYLKDYKFPEFYRGIYLNIGSALNVKKLKKFIKKANDSNINAFVLDVQSSKYRKSIVPWKNIKLCYDNGIHPIARIVVFPGGLKRYPIPKWLIKSKLDIAESACKAGFKEIQFDYIRFNDSRSLRFLKHKDRYKFIESFLLKARARLKKYDVKIAADIFGRIPFNRNDIIGQQMESLDKVVDIICPMAYPSHYWTKKMKHNPYRTVYLTSKKAKDRTKNAEIVSWIQGFKMHMGGINFAKYQRAQIKAVHDAKIKGFIFWNARQLYNTTFAVTKKYYSKKKI